MSLRQLTLNNPPSMTSSTGCYSALRDLSDPMQASAPTSCC